MYTRYFLIDFLNLHFLQQWLDSQTSLSDSRSLSPPQASDLSSGGSPPMSHLSPQNLQSSVSGQLVEDEIIPTAIVIKNIPFNVKRETLLDIIVRVALQFCPVTILLTHFYRLRLAFPRLTHLITISILKVNFVD